MSGPLAQRVEKGIGQRFQEVKPSSVRATVSRMKAAGNSFAFISNTLSLSLPFVRSIPSALSVVAD